MSARRKVGRPRKSDVAKDSNISRDHTVSDVLSGPNKLNDGQHGQSAAESTPGKTKKCPGKNVSEPIDSTPKVQSVNRSKIHKSDVDGDHCESTPANLNSDLSTGQQKRTSDDELNADNVSNEKSSTLRSDMTPDIAMPSQTTPATGKRRGRPPKLKTGQAKPPDITSLECENDGPCNESQSGVFGLESTPTTSKRLSRSKKSEALKSMMQMSGANRSQSPTADADLHRNDNRRNSRKRQRSGGDSESTPTAKRQRGRPQRRSAATPKATNHDSEPPADLQKQDEKADLSAGREDEGDSDADDDAADGVTRRPRDEDDQRNEPELSTKPDDEINNSTAVKEKKKRGRKPKPKQTLEDQLPDDNIQEGSVPTTTDNHDDEPYTPVQQGSKRGRKPKPKQPAVESDEGDDINLPRETKPRRGRKPKPKRAADSDEDYGVNLSRKTKTKQSRKPKHKGPISCVHCDSVVQSAADMKAHMLHDHLRVWTEDNPEGTVNISQYFKKYKSLTCKQCKKTFHYSSYYNTHLRWCGRESETTACKTCGSVVKSMWFNVHKTYCDKKQQRIKQQEEAEEARLSVFTTPEVTEGRTKRRAATKAAKTLKSLEDDDDEAYDSDRSEEFKIGKESESSSSENSVGDPEDDIADENGKNTKKSSQKSEKQGRTGSKSRTPNLNLRGTPLRSRGPRWKAAAEITRQRHELLGSRTVHPSWRPDVKDWTLLTPSERESYLPDQRDSVSFKVSLRRHMPGEGQKLFLQKYRKHLDAEKHVDSTTESLPFTKSRKFDGHTVSYTGGPIWAMSWCPLPLSEVDNDQYLAIYSHKSPDQRTSLEGATDGRALIQLWNCGKIANKSKSDFEPSLQFCIASESGTVMDLKWCPFGAYDKTIGRLGLLAGAMSNGNVHIYSLPFFEELSQESSDVDIPVYNIQTAAILSPNADVNTPADCACVCIDWCLTPSETRVAAGFSDGFVSLWDLDTTSGLLLNHDKAGRLVITPYRTFQCHIAPVVSVAFCALLTDRLITASHDRLVKFWNLKEPDWSPLSQIRCRLQTMCFTTFWPSCLVSGDDCNSAGQNQVCLIDGMNSTVQSWSKNLSSHTSTVWSLSHNTWQHHLVSCDAVGALCFMQLYAISEGNQPRKSLIKTMVPLIVTKKLSLRDAGDGNEDSIRKDGDFLDYTMYSNPGFVVEQPALQAENITETPTQALHKVAFNPNMTSYNWLAVGGQAGLLIIRPVNLS